MNRLGLTFSILVLPLALAASLATPCLAADENLNLKMTLAGTVLDDRPDGPVFNAVTNGRGHVNILDIDLPASPVTIVGLQVEFDVDVCLPGCSKFTTFHYVVHFDKTTGTATGDPNNPNTLFVEGNPTGGMVHRTGGGAPDRILLFAMFDYSAGPTVGYDVNFTFKSTDFGGDAIVVMLHGPA